MSGLCVQFFCVIGDNEQEGRHVIFIGFNKWDYSYICIHVCSLKRERERANAFFHWGEGQVFQNIVEKVSNFQ